MNFKSILIKQMLTRPFRVIFLIHQWLNKYANQVVCFLQKYVRLASWAMHHRSSVMSYGLCLATDFEKMIVIGLLSNTCRVFLTSLALLISHFS